MKFMSLFGMMILLLIAWLMSYDRKTIRIRTVVWGMALQFLFAIIILQKNVFSFLKRIIPARSNMSTKALLT